MGGTVFRTRLVRRPAGDVAVIPQLITPLQTAKWLVLGFPPVRGIGIAPQGDVDIDTGARKPTVDDVLPLLTSEVDARLDDVQAWVREAAGTWLDKGPAPPSVERFFRVLGHLTPEREGAGQPHFSRIGDGGRVMVATSDGEVPLEYLSQGMGSVLSWVGTLIARLEALQADKPPGKSDSTRAIVLVDEIDAHLHPAWQRQIVRAVEREFEHLQVIATTHSPLVVGSLETDDDHPAPRLWRLFRDGPSLRHERLDLHYGGWRADQILTSKAFDLPTAYDVTTQGRLEDIRQRHADPEPTPEDQEELRELIEDLDELLRRPESRPVERAAAELVSQWLEKSLDELTEEERIELLQEAERYLVKLQTGK